MAIPGRSPGASARQRLALEYQAACRQAEQVQIDIDQGILRTTRCRLDQPQDPRLLEVSNRLSRVFALQGRGFFRRMPSLLEVELSQYVASVEKICHSHSELGGRLRLVQAVIMVFGRTPEFCGPNFFRLALISPESAWLLFHLRRKRRSGRQAMQDLLSKR